MTYWRLAAGSAGLPRIVPLQCAGTSYQFLNQPEHQGEDVMNLPEDWKARIAKLDQLLQPIAKRPVDITRPGWLGRLRAGVPPLDEAGAREAAESLLAEILAAYAQGPTQTRTAIRQLFQQHRSFAWAATLSVPRTTSDGLRQHLLLFSIIDQGRDCRDAWLTLQEMCQGAKAAGLDPEPILREVAAVSSDENKYGMGSTRQMLLKHCENDRPDPSPR